MTRILVVDDEPEVARSMERQLAREGFETSVATGPQEALAVLEDFSPHLVITDCRMPGMSGIQLCAEVRRRRPGTPFIFVSGYPGATVDPGVAAKILQKPWQKVTLLARIREELAAGGSP
jgi:CheY-like chemotaxis protein